MKRFPVPIASVFALIGVCTVSGFAVAAAICLSGFHKRTLATSKGFSPCCRFPS